MRLSTFLRPLLAATLVTAGCWIASPLARAHFIWLAPVTADSEPVALPAAERVELYFGEAAQPDNPALLDLLDRVELWSVSASTFAGPVKPSRAGDSLSVKLAHADTESTEGSILVAKQDFGVRNKGGESFRLKYYAKVGPPLDSPLWAKVDTESQLELDITPRLDDGRVRLQVRFAGSPAGDAEVVISGPQGDGDGGRGETDADGEYVFSPHAAGRYSIRARHIDATAGKVDGEAFDDTRHYVTLTLDVPGSVVSVPSQSLAELPTTLTSFGGAVLGDDVYVYGGTKGSSHDYSSAVQNDSLLRLSLPDGRWETVARGPKLQGLAMVPHGGKLYRIGGFEARNAPDQEHDLWSVDSVAAFDPASGEWSELPPLPEPRSSFDAAVLGDSIYVIGGWAMAGDGRSVWHQTAWRLDLSASEPSWQAIAEPPFERRALAVAAHDGRIFAIGGMTSGDDTSRETDIYDPQSDTWVSGPELVGDGHLAGFGASAFATGGQLYVSNVAGSLQRFDADADAWTVVARTPTARFFHRMLPVDDASFVIVGGSNMSGRITAVERWTLPAIVE